MERQWNVSDMWAFMLSRAKTYRHATEGTRPGEPSLGTPSTLQSMLNCTATFSWTPQVLNGGFNVSKEVFT